MRPFSGGPIGAGAALLLLLPSTATAGLHYSGEKFAELPSRMSGFLVDHRSLRAARRRHDPPRPDDRTTAVGVSA